MATAAKPTRAERVAETQRLYAAGFSIGAIAERLGVSRSSASAYINDPDLAKQAARRARYAGACEVCGAPTDGSNGRAQAPRRCEAHHPSRELYWTAERVIDAIRRWANAHGGKPPTVNDWLYTDPVNDYPSASGCYRRVNSTSNAGAAFASWADAIEAAGFDRPTNLYERTAETRARSAASVRAYWARKRGGA